MIAFRWSSFLGLGTILFLSASVFELLIGVFAPNIGLPPTIVGLSSGTDLTFYGRSSTELLSDPTVFGLRTHHTIVVGGLLVGLGVLGISVGWFGLRKGERWALGAMIASELVMWPYWAMMIGQYTSVGVQVALIGDVQPFVIVPAALTVPGIVFSWVGLRRQS